MSVWRVLRASFLRPLVCATGYAVIGDILGFVPPLCLEFMVDFVSDRQDPQVTPQPWTGYLLVASVVIALVVQNLCWERHLHAVLRAGMHAQTGVMGAVYAKALRLSTQARNRTSVGRITNLYSGDALQLRKTVVRLSALVSAPLIIIVSLVLLYRQLGPATFVGFAVLVALTPTQIKMGRRLKKLQKATLKHGDQRLKLVNEIVQVCAAHVQSLPVCAGRHGADQTLAMFAQGIRVIKFHAWEGKFGSKYLGFRRKELSAIRYLKYLTALYDSLVDSAIVLVALATFVAFGWWAGSDELTPSKAFSALALLHLMSFPLNILINTINFLISCNVSLDRLKRFMLLGELQGYVDAVPDRSFKAAGISEHVAVSIHNGSFCWDEPGPASSSQLSSKSPDGAIALHDVDFHAVAGGVTGIVGSVGAGKSTLLSAILGDALLLHGEVRVGGRVAYCAQVPWIMNTTLRDNILFGQPYDEHKFKCVLHVCALELDVRSLPAGDLTEIGARGVNLSGGQKARVSLARAVYSDADTYIMDDVLSACDAHTSRWIFDKCVHGWLAGQRSWLGVEAPTAPATTRVLVTHHVALMSRMDHVFVLDAGHVVAHGPGADICTSGTEMESFVSSLPSVAGVGDDVSGDDAAGLSASQVHASVPGEQPVVEQTSTIQSTPAPSKDESKTPDAAPADENAPTSDHAGATSSLVTTAAGKGGSLTEKEEREVGAVRGRVYLQYLVSCGLFFGVATLFLRVAANGVLVATDWALSEWSTQAGGRALGYYLTLYASLAGGSVVVTLLYNVSWAVASTHAAAALHQRMLARILAAPVSFFDVTPAGRILNRCAARVPGFKNLRRSRAHHTGFRATPPR